MESLIIYYIVPALLKKYFLQKINFGITLCMDDQNYILKNFCLYLAHCTSHHDEEFVGNVVGPAFSFSGRLLKQT